MHQESHISMTFHIYRSVDAHLLVDGHLLQECICLTRLGLQEMDSPRSDLALNLKPGAEC